MMPPTAKTPRPSFLRTQESSLLLRAVASQSLILEVSPVACLG